MLYNSEKVIFCIFKNCKNIQGIPFNKNMAGSYLKKDVFQKKNG